MSKFKLLDIVHYRHQMIRFLHKVKRVNSIRPELKKTGLKNSFLSHLNLLNAIFRLTFLMPYQVSSTCSFMKLEFTSIFCQISLCRSNTDCKIPPFQISAIREREFMNT